MDDSLFFSLKDILPELLIGLAAVEGLLYLSPRHGSRSVLIVALLIVVGLSIVSYYTAPEWSYHREHRPLLYFAVSFVIYLVPMAVLTLVALGASKLRPLPAQALAIGSAFALAFLFPLWGLFVVCTSGMDCT